jgi:hypothetical protein
VQVPCDEGVAIRIGPESCAEKSAGLRRSVDTGAHRPVIEAKESHSGCRRRAEGGRQHVRARQRKRQDDPARSPNITVVSAAIIRRFRLGRRVRTLCGRL